MKRNHIWQLIELELRAAKKKHPNWPDHVCAQAGIVVEEAGELMRAALQWKYERNANEVVEEQQKEELKKEAIQTAVTAIRFLENLK
jgi:sugar (pentulose or hexulose) kinase